MPVYVDGVIFCLYVASYVTFANVTGDVLMSSGTGNVTFFSFFFIAKSSPAGFLGVPSYLSEFHKTVLWFKASSEKLLNRANVNTY